MASTQKIKWTEIRKRWMNGEWLSLRAAAQDLGIGLSTIKHRSMKEGWIAKKEQIEAEAEGQAKERIIRRLTQEFEKSILRRLQSADVLRYKGMEALADTKTRLQGADAIRAIGLSAQIESEIFTGAARSRITLPQEDPDETQGGTEQESPEEARAALHGRLVRLAAGPQASKGPGPAKP